MPLGVVEFIWTRSIEDQDVAARMDNRVVVLPKKRMPFEQQGDKQVVAAQARMIGPTTRAASIANPVS